MFFCFFSPFPCVCTLIFFSLTWLTTSALTQSQGILGFVDHPGNSLLCTPETVLQREGRMFITVGFPVPPALNLLSSPTSCLYITLPSPCAHPRPDVFPLFIVCQSRTDLATESVVCHTKCFLCPFCDQSRDSVVWHVWWSVKKKQIKKKEEGKRKKQRPGFCLRKIKVYIFWNLICKDLRVYHIWHRKRQMLIKKISPAVCVIFRLPEITMPSRPQNWMSKIQNKQGYQIIFYDIYFINSCVKVTFLSQHFHCVFGTNSPCTFNGSLMSKRNWEGIWCNGVIVV